MPLRQRAQKISCVKQILIKAIPAVPGGQQTILHQVLLKPMLACAHSQLCTQGWLLQFQQVRKWPAAHGDEAGVL